MECGGGTPSDGMLAAAGVVDAVGVSCVIVASSGSVEGGGAKLRAGFVVDWRAAVREAAGCAVGVIAV